MAVPSQATPNPTCMTIKYSEWSTTQATIVSSLSGLLLNAVKGTKGNPNSLHKNKVRSGASTSFVIVDYGAADGCNSRFCFRQCIDYLRIQHGGDFPIFIYYNDLPANAFSALFDNLKGNMGKDLGLEMYGNVFYAALGRSFYDQILPENYVDIGLCATSVHWLSKLPCFILDDLFIHNSRDEAAWSKFQQQADEDWRTFLTKRQQELSPGGTLVISVPGTSDPNIEKILTPLDQFKGAQFYSTLSTIWEKFADQGKITSEEFKSTNVQYYLRTFEELTRPFKDGSLPDLNLTYIQGYVVMNSTYEKYKHDMVNKNKTAIETFADQATNEVRVFTENTFLTALKNKTKPEQQIIIDELFESLRKAVIDNPTIFDLSWSNVILSITKERQKWKSVIIL